MTEDQSTVEYREIPEFPNYRVGDDGSVWSQAPGQGNRHAGKGWRRLRPKTGRNYLAVNPCKDGRIFTREIHRLVLLAFVGPCPPGMEGCHQNGDRHDNRLSNLRWDTRKNNHADKARHGTQPRGERIHNSKLTAEQVVEIRRILASLKRPAPYGYLQTLCERFGVSKRHLSDIRTRKCWRHLV